VAVQLEGSLAVLLSVLEKRRYVLVVAESILLVLLVKQL
jgi:hypothetical protein